MSNSGLKLSPLDKKGLLDHVMVLLKGNKVMEQLPSKTGRDVYSLIGEYLQNPDIYKDAKNRSNEEARQLYPIAKAKVASSKDPLKTAANVAIVGNLIDLGTNHHGDLQAEIDALRLAVDHFDTMKADLSRAKSLLYIADNAGEVFFDKVFLEEITREYNIKISYAVRAGPIINDATADDAKIAGIDKLATIIDGTQSPGVILEEAPPEFLRAYKTADVIIAKGQGNFEALSEQPKLDNLFFLLMAKCEIMEEYFHVPIGSAILAHWRRM
jgi:damage-control phosphatase, subfamily I